MRRIKPNLRRTPLNKRKGKDEFAILVHGFGEALGQTLVGKVVRMSSRNVRVKIRDGDEVYEESYSRHTGIRLSDAEEESGWMINLKELDPKVDLVSDTKARQSSLERIKLKHRERHPNGEDEELVAEVWYDKELQEHFAKFYRTSQTKGGKQRCFLIPFQLMKRVIADFEVDWESIDG